MIVLRPDQTDLQDKVLASMQSGKRFPLAVAPCGFGKTVVFCDYAQKVQAKGNRMLILSHRDELVDQISLTLEAFKVPHSFIAAGRPYNRARLVQVASVMSLARRLKEAPESIDQPDIIIIDEAHHGVAGSWKTVLSYWPNVRRLGVTATPQRMSGEPLGEIFDDLIVGPTAGELIQMGALSPYTVIAPEVPEMMGLGRNKSGDFDKSEIAKRRKPQVVGDAVAQYIRHARGKRAVVFEVSIETAQGTAQSFQQAGFRSAFIDGKMAKAERREIVQMYRDGFIDVLSTCDLISEGFDLPAIEVAICLRPTDSLALWIQQFGRALRKHPGKEKAIILDHANNTLRHMWLPESEVEWSLDGKAKIKTVNDSGPSVRTCPFCHAAQFNTGGLQACKNCGTLFTQGGEARTVSKIAGELEELSPEMLAQIASQKRVQQGRAETFAELVELFRSRGEKNPVGHARHVWKAREDKRLQQEAERNRQLKIQGVA